MSIDDIYEIYDSAERKWLVDNCDAVRAMMEGKQPGQPDDCCEAFNAWWAKQEEDFVHPDYAVEIWQAAWVISGRIAASNIIRAHQSKKREAHQPVDIPDLVTLIQNAQTDFLLGDEGIDIHDADILSDAEAEAIIASLRPYLRRPEREAQQYTDKALDDETIGLAANAYLEAMLNADIPERALAWFGRSDCAVNAIGLKAALKYSNSRRPEREYSGHIMDTSMKGIGPCKNCGIHFQSPEMSDKCDSIKEQGRRGSDD